MPDIGVVITGDRQVELQFEQFPQRAHANLKSRITSITDQLEARVRQRVPKRTGKLQSEIESNVVDKPERITGWVYVDAEYAKAGALEYGAHGTAKVSEHSAKLDHVWAKKLDSPITMMISAHRRQLDLMARRFLRDPIAEMSSSISQSLQQAVAETIDEGAT